jgi:hypothetical protein
MLDSKASYARAKICRERSFPKNLIAFQADDSFFLQIVTGGESLVYHWNPLPNKNRGIGS